MASKFIVTGAAGFIGSTITQRLLDRGDTVVGVDRITDYYDERIKRSNLAPLNENPNFTHLEKDMTTVDWAAELDGVEAVFHQAAQPGVRASWGENFEIYTQQNILATQALLEQSKGKNVRIVYASSSSVYGDSPQLPMKEDQTTSPQSPYGVTKLAAENLCCLYWRNFQVETVSLRYFTVYGPKQRPDMAFHRFIKAGLLEESITLYGDGEQTRDFTFVDDIVTANLAAAAKGEPGGVYNLGGGSRITVNEVLAKIEKTIGKPLKIDRRPQEKGDVRHTYADTSRAKTDLGFDPQYSLDAGLAREAEWVESSLSLLS